MSVGRPIVPKEIKQARGTYRADRDKPPVFVPETPSNAFREPLEPLGEAGSQFWALAASTPWISGSTDLPIVLLLAKNFDERSQLVHALEQDTLNRPLRASLRELDKQLISGLSRLGLSPTDRAKLGLVEAKAETKLEALLRRRAEWQSGLTADE